MPAGRLFWKFFSTIWLALLVSGAIVAAVVSMLHTSANRNVEVELGPRASYVVDTAELVLHSGGAAALRTEVLEWDRTCPGGARVYVVDDAGNDILGRPVSPHAVAQARELVQGLAPDGLHVADKAARSEAVRLVEANDHKAYLLFVPVNSIAPFPGHATMGRHMPHQARGGVWPELFPILATLFASVAGSALLAWYFSKPIRHLRWAFGAVANGHLETRVQPLMGKRRDEIADLGRDFDAMVQQLEQVVGVQRRLLHDVSHELRSPLARLQLAIDLARQDPSRLESTLQRIELESTRLNELVGELLTLSALESGTSAGRKSTVNLIELVAGVADDARFEARANYRDLTYSGQGELLVYIHVEPLLRAVENVMRNAVKYTREGSTVSVEVSKADTGQALVAVNDLGPGVPPEQLEIIFEPFFRSDNAVGTSGFGLGLAIARRAIVASGGSIRAKNIPGAGLRIEILIPAVN